MADYRAAAALVPGNPTAWAGLVQILKDHPEASTAGSGGGGGSDSAVDWPALCAEAESALALAEAVADGGAAAKLHFALFTTHHERARRAAAAVGGATGTSSPLKGPASPPPLWSSRHPSSAAAGGGEEAEEARAAAWGHLERANALEFARAEAAGYWGRREQQRAALDHTLGVFKRGTWVRALREEREQAGERKRA